MPDEEEKIRDDQDSSEDPSASRHLVPEIRFCPFCGQMSFAVMAEEQGSVYCEFCGIDVAIEELVKTV